MRIVITNAYSWFNKGDAGILLATIDVLKKIYKHPKFDILSFTPEEDWKRYCKDQSINGVYSNILNPHPYKHTKLGKLNAIIKIGRQMIKNEVSFLLPILRKKNKIFNILQSADLIVVCGGGFLGGKKYNSFLHLYQINFNTKFGKPVYIIGTSIEPISKKIIKNITKKVLNKVDYIFAREVVTYNYLRKNLPKNKYCLIPDMAFMLNDQNHKFKFIEELKKQNKKIIGITVRKWNFPECDDKKKLMETYINELVKTFDYFIENKKYIFVFVPQVIIDYGNDVDVAESIKNKLKLENKTSFIVKSDDWSPYELKALISNFDGFLGTRMHSNIFATSVGVPTVAIAYEKKTNGIMHMLDLNDYVVEINNISSDELIFKINKIMNGKNNAIIRKKLNSKIVDIRKEVMEKMKNMSDLY